MKGLPMMKGMKGMKKMGSGSPSKVGGGIGGGNMSGLGAGLAAGPRKAKAGRVGNIKSQLFGKGGM